MVNCKYFLKGKSEQKTFASIEEAKEFVRNKFTMKVVNPNKSKFHYLGLEGWDDDVNLELEPELQKRALILL